MARGSGLPVAPWSDPTIQATGTAVADPICLRQTILPATLPSGAFSASLATFRTVLAYAADPGLLSEVDSASGLWTVDVSLICR